MSAFRLYTKSETFPINTLYLLHCLKTEHAFQYFKDNANTTTNISNLSYSSLSAFKIPLPPLQIQDEIVKEIERFQKIIDGAKQVIEYYRPSFKIEENWKRFKFEDVTHEIRNGVNVEQIDDKGKYRVTRIQTISNGTVDLDKTKWTNDEPSDNYFMEEGDILLSHINSFEHLAKTAIFTNIKDKVVHGINLIRYRFKKELIIPDYAILFMKSDEFISKARSFAQRAVNQASIKTSDLKKIELPCPDLNIQKQIVEKVKEEVDIIELNKRLVEIFEKKIKDRIGDVWDE